MQIHEIETADLEGQILQFVQTEIIENPDSEVTGKTPLISSGLMNSLLSLKMVSFLEDTFEIEMAAHEVSVDYLDTVNQMIDSLRRTQRSD